jgi:glycosyltransferase involved in cell wall biosynthesis
MNSGGYSDKLLPTSPRMRILVDCAPLSGGGGSQVASAFLENLAGTNEADWRAIATDRTISALSPQLQNDVRIKSVKKRNWVDILRIGRLLAHEERVFQPDVVFSIFGPTYFEPRVPHLVGFALPLMIYDIEPPLREPTISDRLKTWLGRRAFKRAVHIVVETETVKERLNARLGISETNISVIGNSVNPLFAAALAQTVSPPDDIFRMIVPSAYYPHKNLEIIPSVAAELKLRDPDLAFEFLCTLDPSLPQWVSIAQEASRLGVAEHIQTIGTLTLPELAHHYQHSSAVFLPTIREASTAVYPESFQARRPLLTSDFDFARDLCGDAALYFPPTDAASIADVVLELVKDVGLQAGLISQGEARLRTSYPTASEKFAQQMRLLHVVAGTQIKNRRNVKKSAAPWRDNDRANFSAAYDRSTALSMLHAKYLVFRRIFNFIFGKGGEPLVELVATKA